MFSLKLPQYSPSVSAPSYSFEPTCGERTLEVTPRPLRLLAESIYIKQSGKTTVILHNQEENVKIPSYGREGAISGSGLFHSSNDICEVVLEIYGKIETMSSDAGANTTPVVDMKRVLWSESQQDARCPRQIEFLVRLPPTFRDDQGEERPLPPTYAVDFHGVPALYVRTSYFMQILVTRRRSGKLGFLRKTKRIFMPFEYYPRTRPRRPIVPQPCFYTGVKSTPEEWYQTIMPMKTQQNGDCGPISANLLIPSARIYGIRDTIPFHVQLSGPEAALRTFLRPKKRSSCHKGDPSANVKTSHPAPSLFPVSTPKTPSLANVLSQPGTARFFDTGTTNPGSPTLPSVLLSRTISSPQHPPSAEHAPPLLPDDATRPTLRVFLLRQVTLEIRGAKKSWRNQILGEANLVTVPPLLATSYYSPCGDIEPQEEDHLDWEGELQVNEKYKIGGWQGAGVHVKDFIALSVVPQNERTSLLCGIHLTVPVKLVTDLWTEGATVPQIGT